MIVMVKVIIVGRGRQMGDVGFERRENASLLKRNKDEDSLPNVKSEMMMRGA
jgi:hypothetical protein